MDIPFPGRWGLVTAAALLLSTGCAHYPYGPSYYNSGPYSPMPNYGPTMAPSGGYMSPGPVYTPTGPGLQPLPGNPGLPGNPASPTPISPSYPQSTPTWTPDTSRTPSAPLNDAPPFRPNPSNGNGAVPFPVEPDFSAPPAAALPRAMPISEAPTPFPSRPVSSTSTDDPFEAPRRVQSMPTEIGEPFAMDASAGQVNRQDPYGYDGDKYTWLRGMVDYDVPTKTWSIIYNLTPDIRDKFGGSFVFAPHPSLATLKPGALVLAKGRVDPGRTDSHGKALYEIVQMIHLAPPAGIQ